MRNEMNGSMRLVCGLCWHELVTMLDGTLNKIWEHTCSDIMIEIHLPNIKNVLTGLSWEDLIDNCPQPLICWHEVYKIAKNSYVNDVIPNVFAVVDSLLKRTLKPQADFICTPSVYVGIKLKSLWKFGGLRQRSHVCGWRSWEVTWKRATFTRKTTNGITTICDRWKSRIAGNTMIIVETYLWVKTGTSYPDRIWRSPL